MAFTVTGIHETYGTTTVIVTMVVVYEEAFAITKGDQVKEVDGAIITKMDLTSTKYDYYTLSHTQEYTVYKHEGAVVIPPEGEVWRYDRPD